MFAVIGASMKAHHLWLVAVLMSAPWTSTAAATLPTEGRMPPLGRATAWLNSQPLDTQELRGKVVLVDFWTYTCINWRRTLPYLRAWAEKYRDDGLVVIGVHTPEFGFEKDLDNVRRQAQAASRRLPDRGRQRLFDLECLQQPVLARPLLHRRARLRSPPSIRRRRLRPPRRNHSAAADRGRAHEFRAWLRCSRRTRCGSRGRLEKPAVAGNVRRLGAR